MLHCCTVTAGRSTCPGVVPVGRMGCVHCKHCQGQSLLDFAWAFSRGGPETFALLHANCGVLVLLRCSLGE